MTWTALAVVAVYGGIILLWVVLNILILCYSPRRHFLGRKAHRLCGTDGPRVSILLAAKDEEDNIGPCIRSVLSSDYHNLDLIVLDDRSTDNTAQAVRQAVAADPRVRLIQINHLPPGWSGKVNALRHGLKQASGEVILIMDADSRHCPETLGTALAALLRSNSSLLSLLPRFDHRSLFSKLVQPMVGSLICIWKPLIWVNGRKKHNVFLAWGGFLMVRRADLEAVGGFEAVKDQFAADIALAGLVKKSGRRIRVFHAPQLVSTYLYAGISDILRGWTRLLRITADNRPGQLGVTLAALGILGLSAYAMIGLGLAGWCSGAWLLQLLGGMGLAHLALQVLLLGQLCRISGTRPRYALGHLLGMVMTCYLTALALIRCRSTQMTWRGTQYRLQRDGRACG